MPFNVLLLPLIGGYLFITLWQRTRYAVLRADGQRLLLNSACAGAFFLSLATLLVVYGEQTDWGVEINRVWHRTVPFQYSGRTFLAFLLGTFGWWPLNRIWSKDAEIQRVILEKGDALEVLLRRAVGEKRWVALTVKSGKVYVGLVTMIFNPAFPLEHIKLVPMLSGYRREPDKHLIFTNFYLQIYDKLRAATEAELLRQLQRAHPQLSGAELQRAVAEQIDRQMPSAEFELVIPRGEIQAANLFDLKIYEQHFQVDPVSATATKRKRKASNLRPTTETAP